MTNSLCLISADEQADPIVIPDSSDSTPMGSREDGVWTGGIDGYIEAWMFVSIPEFGTFSLLEVLEEGSAGWDAFAAFGEPIESYEPIDIFIPIANTNNAGVTVLMPVVSCLGDFNYDGIVDSGDLVVFAQAYIDGDQLADITYDGNIDIADQLLFFDLATSGCIPNQ